MFLLLCSLECLTNLVVVEVHIRLGEGISFVDLARNMVQDLATPSEDRDFAPSEMVLRIVPSQHEWLEAQIDALNEGLAPLTSFVLPGGSEAAARVHVARATTRAAERIMTELAGEADVNPAALAYINRLSDLLFVLARVLNDGGATDVKWVPGANR